MPEQNNLPPITAAVTEDDIQRIITATLLNLGSNIIRSGTGNQVFKATSEGIQVGNAVFADAPFRVSMDGTLTATGATIKSASSGARIEISSATNQLILYNASGNAQVTLGDVGAGSAVFTIDLKDVTKSGIILQNTVVLGSSDFLLRMILGGATSAGKGIDLSNAGTGTAVNILHSNATGGAMILENSSASNASATLTVNNAGTGPSINAQKYIILPNQTIANANADQINIGGADISAGNTTFAFRTEGTGVVLTGQADVASATRVKIVINGTTYTLLAE